MTKNPNELSWWQKLKIARLVNKTTNQLTNMKSWKTSLGGILTALGVALTQIEGPEWLEHSAGVLAAVGVLITGLFARDNDKSSQDVGIRD